MNKIDIETIIEATYWYAGDFGFELPDEFYEFYDNIEEASEEQLLDFYEQYSDTMMDLDEALYYLNE